MKSHFDVYSQILKHEMGSFPTNFLIHHFLQNSTRNYIYIYNIFNNSKNVLIIIDF